MNVTALLLITCFLAYVAAENAYGDEGIVLTAAAATVDEEYQNIVSIPGSPPGIDATAEEYPGLNFDFVFRRPISCDVDYSKNELYVYDYYLRGLLLLENYNSSAIKEEITISRQHYGISKEYSHVAVDWLSHNVYVTDPLLGRIILQPGGAINDPSRYHVVVRNIDLPRGLAVDPVAGYLFWTDYGRNVLIWRSTLTGDRKTTIVHSKITQPNSVVVDPTENRIYWSDLQYLESASYDGTGRRHLFRGNEASFFDVALFRDVLIATDMYGLLSRSGEYSTRLFNKSTGEELEDKRITVTREAFYGACMYSGEYQRPRPELDHCKTAVCQHICVNEATQATCLCNEGFVLDTDQTSCIEDGGQHQSALIFSTGRNLCLLDMRALSDKHDYKPVCFYNGTENENITLFDVNTRTREVYFAEGNTIYKVFVDRGSDGRHRQRDVLEVQSYDITGLSFDYSSNRLYFGIASDPPQLWFFNVNTGAPSFLHNVKGGDMRSLTVRPEQNKVYWLAGLNLLQSVDIAGVVSPEITNVSLVYHPVGFEVYPKRMVHDNKYEEFFVLIEGFNGHSDLISIDYSGNVTSYLATDDDIADFAIYKEYIVYITHKDGKHIVRSGDLGLGYPLQTVDEGTIDGLDEVYAIGILDFDHQRMVQNPCGPNANNGGCEHICIPQNDAAVCQCKLGFTLHSDGQQCISSPVGDDFIIATDLTFNEAIQFPLNDPTNFIGIRTPALDRPDGVLYNYQTKEMFWASTDAAMIWAVHLNGTGLREVSDVQYSMLGYPDQLALDPSTGNIYYTTVSYYADDLYDSPIAVIDKHGRETIVIWEGHRPRDLEVDPAAGLMFWGDYSGFFPGVFRANMDGSDKITLHMENVTWPNGIALDYNARRIYWTDGFLDTISYSDYDGNNRNELLKVDSGLRLMDLELVGDYLYYTAMGSHKITRVHKDNINDIRLYGPEAGLGRLYGLDVYSSTAPTNTPVNPGCAANNGGCSHFCFPIPDGFSCGCNMYSELLADNKTCEDAPLCTMYIPNGEIIESPTCVGAEENTCSYTCESGYRPLSSVPTIRCTSTLDWDISDPCEKVTCPDYIENGVISGNCSLLPDDVCVYMCQDGFEPNTDMTHIMCEETGNWNYTASDVVLCSETTTVSSRKSGKSKNIAIGVGVGVGLAVLIVIIVIVVIFLIRSGKISKPGKSAGASNSFENPRYADNSVQLGSAGGQADTAFGYTTLSEDKMAASATNTTYDNIKPRI